MAGDLYPEITPYETGRLKLDDRHVMYFEESGNRDGVPVVFLHGGPGGGTQAIFRRFFDPGHYRIILFDQRGSGRSTPLGELTGNTTPDLISDMERLRRHLDIESWFAFGGSWGSTLALAYAQTHPDPCRGLILRGIFLCRQKEIDWFLYGMGTIFPEAWAEFAELIPAEERHDLLAAYYRRLTNPDPQTHMEAATAWSVYEGRCSTLLPNEELVASFADPVTALGIARIEAHYFINDIFIDANALLDRIDRIRHIPAVIVQGRYDIVCPIATAQELTSAWPQARYQVIDDAGHSALEPGIRSALVATTDEFRDLDAL
ncbi:MAG: prolyl aminopeptidase [Alphaproteobacteria bacterium]|nr:prolyl aminopeptidase [Alphaproteobacteria bacterium]